MVVLGFVLVCIVCFDFACGMLLVIYVCMGVVGGLLFSVLIVLFTSTYVFVVGLTLWLFGWKLVVIWLFTYSDVFVVDLLVDGLWLCGVYLLSCLCSLNCGCCRV